jgi:hypothetical protein
MRGKTTIKIASRLLSSNNYLVMQMGCDGKGKGRGYVHPRTGHERPEVEYKYSSTLSLTSVLDRGWVVNATHRPLYTRERPSTHCTGGWVDPRASQEM